MLPRTGDCDPSATRPCPAIRARLARGKMRALVGWCGVTLPHWSPMRPLLQVSPERRALTLGAGAGRRRPVGAAALPRPGPRQFACACELGGRAPDPRGLRAGGAPSAARRALPSGRRGCGGAGRGAVEQGRGLKIPGGGAATAGLRSCGAVGQEGCAGPGRPRGRTC